MSLVYLVRGANCSTNNPVTLPLTQGCVQGICGVFSGGTKGLELFDSDGGILKDGEI
jgi:hypothetical protein